jgi:hypothetical protein
MKGGGKIPYLYHGTSMFYVDRISKDGLTGKYDSKLLKQMIEIFPIIDNGRQEYIHWFFDRQKLEICELSFTSIYTVAEEYAGKERTIGEGPTKFSALLLSYLIDHKKEESEVLNRMRKLYDVLSKAKRYPNLILAIRINDFEDLKEIYPDGIEDTYWEVPVPCPIPPEKIFACLPPESGSNEKRIVPINSEIFKEYYNKKMTAFNDAEEKLEAFKKDNENIWIVDEYITKTGKSKYFYCSIVKDSSSVTVSYDRLVENIKITAFNDGVSLIDVTIFPYDKIVIRNNYQLNDELNEKLNLALEHILPLIEDNKEYYIRHIKEILDDEKRKIK